MINVTKTNSGFTLIEVLVVTSIAVMIILASTALFFTFMVGTSRTNLRQKVKANGRNALGKIEHLVRNSRSIRNCSTNSLEIENLDGRTSTIHVTDHKIASSSSTTNYFLTSEEITVSNLSFDCYQNQASQYVEVNFTLSRGESTDDLETFDENFSSGILLRNTSF
jgi:prepilin-type N-terminal cleavage/methylation domain-containing protein